MINGFDLLLIIAIILLVMVNFEIRSGAHFWKFQASELSKKINDELINKQTNKQNSR